jgi:hypothetical protein
MIVIGLAAALFVPYPTHVFPALTFQVVDQSGRVPERVPSLHWYGVTNVEYLEGKVPFDSKGIVRLSEKTVWASPFARFRALVSTLIPHSGGVRGTWGCVELEVPKGYTLDAQATGITGAATVPGGPDGLYFLSHGAWGDYVTLSIFTPGSKVARNYRVVLKRTSPSGS